MIVVGGPAGSGKSTAFPVSDFGVDPFNTYKRMKERDVRKPRCAV
jgi:Tfp pilus assembly pilus retraction ATPase PilT